MDKLSGAVFIQNNSMGYCLWESMWTLLPVLDELVVLDLGSTDDTFQTLKEIAAVNKKVKIVQGQFPQGTNANEFAILANDVISITKYDNVLYWQADEIWHPVLVNLMWEQLQKGNFDLSFWRIQFQENFQRVKWFPHPVHRVGRKGNFRFAISDEGKGYNSDGMNTTRVNDAQLCSSYDGGYFLRWGEMGEEGIKPYIGEMITDVSNTGAFFENIISKRKAHGPFWNEDCSIAGEPCDQWYAREKNNPNWKKTTTPFNIPPILTYHLGAQTYEKKQFIIDEIKRR
jgi:glycosyltransferase involved in cell wall biosynthesis